jgi:hypothetical protein
MATSTQLAKPGEPGWEPAPGVILRQTLPVGQTSIVRMAWSPDGNLLASACGDIIGIWHISGSLIGNLIGHTGHVWDISWSPDSKKIASASRDNVIILWTTETLSPLRTLTGHSNGVRSVAWSPDGQNIASSSEDRTVRLWDANTGQILQTIQKDSAWAAGVAWSQDGNQFAVALSADKIGIWDVNAQKKSCLVFENIEKWPTPLDVAWSPQTGNRQIASAIGKTIQIWDLSTKKIARVLEGHSSVVSIVAFSIDGRLLASVSSDGMIHLWRTDTWQPIAVITELLRSTPGLALHPYRPLLATVGSERGILSDSLIHIWELERSILLGEPRWPLTEQLPFSLTQGLRTKVERQKETAEQRVVFEQALFRLSSFVESQKLSRPTCFISYAWGDQVETWKDPRVERWVSRLDEDLRKAGLDVLLDQRSNVSIGASIQRFVDQIAARDRILVVGTPLYLKKYENRQSETGSIVAAEMDLISHCMLGTEIEKATVLPLLLSGNERVSLPPSLRRRVYADFRNETNYFATAFDLIVSLYGIPFVHPAVAEWRQQLRGEELVPRRETEEPEFSDIQLTEALSQIGQEARQEAFGAGRPVIVLKGDKPTWVYPDGTERPADSSNGTPSVKVNE